MENHVDSMVVNRPRRFAGWNPNPQTPLKPVSPMAQQALLQALVQSVLDLNQKMDALATRDSQPLAVREVETIKPPETAKQGMVPTMLERVKKLVRLDRSKMREMFD